MKLKELLEMAPYHAKGENPPEHWKKTLELFFSESAVQREFEELGEFDIDRNLYSVDKLKIIARKEGRMVYAVYQDINKYNETGWRVVFVLEFKNKPTLINYPKDINKKLLLQVNKVNTDKNYRELGLASYVYQLLIKKGFIILSDIIQLDGGKALWQKIARRSNFDNYKIRIIDDEIGYLKRNGKILEYDGSNISDDEIWTTEMNFDGEHILLIMSLK